MEQDKLHLSITPPTEAILSTQDLPTFRAEQTDNCEHFSDLETLPVSLGMNALQGFTQPLGEEIPAMTPATQPQIPSVELLQPTISKKPTESHVESIKNNSSKNSCCIIL